MPPKRYQQAYQLYLQKRTKGLTAIKAIAEVKKETRVKLQNLYDRLHFQTPPVSVVTPFEMKIAKAWEHHTSFTIGGNCFSSCFSPTDRMVLIPDIIARQID